MPTQTNFAVVHEHVTQHILDVVTTEIGSEHEIGYVTVDSSLQSHGLDSLRIMSLVFKLEEHYDILLDEEDADDLRTVGDLATLVTRRIGERS